MSFLRGGSALRSCTVLSALSRELQTVSRFLPVVLQCHKVAVGPAGFLRNAAGEFQPLPGQQSGGDLLRELLFLGGKEPAVLPQSKAAISVFTANPFCVFRDDASAAGTAANSPPL